MKIEIGKIPGELTLLRQWVLWRHEKRDGKWTKVPYTIHGDKAAADEPADWSKFVDTVAAMSIKQMDGIGFVFTSTDSYTGIDLDSCRDPDTGEIDTWAEIIISYLDSYTELSPSEGGAHILVKGQLPTSGRRKGRVEMYQSGRFFTMTGHYLDSVSRQIEERQDKLTSLFESIFPEPEKPSPNGRVEGNVTLITSEWSDERIIEAATNANNGPKFAALWSGNMEDYASQSEADMALCSLVAFWVGPDPERIDRLFRASGLYRDKWDKKRGKLTYGERTIERATESGRDYYGVKSDVHVQPEPEEEVYARPKTLAQVRKVFQQWLYLPDTGALDVALATVVANKRSGQPVWLIQVAPGGFGKTEIINPLSVLPYVHSVATLTEASLLSGTSKKDKAKEAKGGLLREIGDFGIILCKDFGSILSLPRDPRAAVLAALREIFDGSWTRRVGTDGGQALEWSGKVGFVGASTPMIDHHHTVMSALGERFIFYRLPVTDEHKRARRALGHRDLENQMRRELMDAVAGLFETINVDDEPRELTDAEQERLIAISRLAAHSRSSVVRDPYGREIELVPGAEAPTRIALTLARLISGLETIGCTNTECWQLVGKISMDSMPQLRRQLIECLYGEELITSTTDIARRLGHPTQTTRRALEDLACYDVVIRHSRGPGQSDEWGLSDWARTDYHEVLAESITVPEKSVIDVSF